MTYSLTFNRQHSYRSERNIRLPVSLNTGVKNVTLLASVDTGAEYCFFEREYADALLIDLERGVGLSCETVTGTFRAYGHELTMSALGIEVSAFVYFYESPNISRNVLGRNGWLDRIRLGLIHHDSLLYLSSYDD